jgi:hypothetical protein
MGCRGYLGGSLIQYGTRVSVTASTIFRDFICLPDLPRGPGGTEVRLLNDRSWPSNFKVRAESILICFAR